MCSVVGLGFLISMSAEIMVVFYSLSELSSVIDVMRSRLDCLIENYLCSVVGIYFLISMPADIVVVACALIELPRCFL